MIESTTVHINSQYRNQDGQTRQSAASEPVRPLDLSEARQNRAKDVLIQKLKYIKRSSSLKKDNLPPVNLNKKGQQQVDLAEISAATLQPKLSPGIQQTRKNHDVMFVISKYIKGQALRRSTPSENCCVCDLEFQVKELFSLTSDACPHKVCSVCASNYLTFNLNAYQLLVCPKIGCSCHIDTTSDLFSMLPPQLRKKYKQFSTLGPVTSTQRWRCCLNPGCSGDGKANMQEPLPDCEQCGNGYCRTCLFSYHAGPCTYFQQELLDNSYKFKICQNCKKTFQRFFPRKKPSLTCRQCNTKVCADCGQVWSRDPCKQGLEPKAEPSTNNSQLQDNSSSCWYNFCECCSNTPRMILWLLCAILGMLVALLNGIAIFLVVLIVSVLAGPFFVFCDLCKDAPCWQIVLLLLFFPIVAVIGSIAFFFLSLFQAKQCCMIWWLFECLDDIYDG